jgi:hypothetical protein
MSGKLLEGSSGKEKSMERQTDGTAITRFRQLRTHLELRSFFSLKDLPLSAGRLSYRSYKGNYFRISAQRLQLYFPILLPIDISVNRCSSNDALSKTLLIFYVMNFPG